MKNNNRKIHEIIDNADLYCYRSRYYDQKLGRFTQRDFYNDRGYLSGNPQVLYNPGQLNDWNYVAGNPVNFIDPMGFAWITYRMESGKTVNINVTSVKEWDEMLNKIKNSGEDIVFFEIVTHTSHGGANLTLDSFFTGEQHTQYITSDVNGTTEEGSAWSLNSHSDLLKEIFADEAIIELEACYSALEGSIGHSLQQILPNAHIFGYTGQNLVNPVYPWESAAASSSDFHEISKPCK